MSDPHIVRRRPAPVVYLFSWREILATLELRNEAENRRRVRRLNDLEEGPILFPRRGGQPKVSRAKLLAWWDRLEERWAELWHRRQDKAATVQATHPYGRTARVVPGISGSIRRRGVRRAS